MLSPRSSTPCPQNNQPRAARLVSGFGKLSLVSTLAVSGLVAWACSDPGMMMGNAGAGAGGTPPVAGMGGATTTGAAGTAGMGGAAGAPTAAPSCNVMTEILQTGAATSCDVAGACHGAGATTGGELFVGTESEIITRLLNQPSLTGNCTGLYIDAVNPSASMLPLKTSNGHATVCPNGVKMPLGLGLDPARQTCLTEWVNLVAAGSIR